MATTRKVRTVAEAPTRAKLKPRVEATTSTAGASYFASSEERTGLEFTSTGCGLLNQVLGGGYVLGRMTNIIGDKSTGKTLLAIEGAANFARDYPDGVIRYVEAEAAFDPLYAQALGMPLERTEFPDMFNDKGESDRTVEWVYDDIVAFIKRLDGKPGFYVVDSLDALSDREEGKRGISDGSFGGNKPKKLGELFRRLVADIETARVALVIISQIRDKIGVTFGETKTRSGGRAMDFYATHCLWLAHIGMIKKTVEKVERVVGVEIRAKCKKNKVGLPFRECDFQILFGWGIDDVGASVEWLLDVGKDEALRELGLTKAGYKTLLTRMRDGEPAKMRDLRGRLDALVLSTWSAVEQRFLPTGSKY